MLTYKLLAVIFFATATGLGEPQIIELDVADEEACAEAGRAIAGNFNAFGLCIDKRTGDTFVWAMKEELENEGPTPLEQLNP